MNPPLLLGFFRKLGFEVEAPTYLAGGDLLACCNAEMLRKTRSFKQRLLPGSRKVKCYRCDRMYLLFLGVLFRIWD